MIKSWRPLALAAAINVTMGAGMVAAQTVIVRSAPAGTPIEVVLNTEAVGAATADANGDAVVPFDMPARMKRNEIDAYIFVDACEKVRRVLVLERAQVPGPAEAGCERRQIVGLFLVRDETSMVVDVGGPAPTVLLRQGAYSLRPPRVWPPPPAGLVLFGGGGLASPREIESVACGDVTDCGREGLGTAYMVGVSYWFGQFVAVEGGYLRPAEATVTGRGNDFRFDSMLDADVYTIGGKVGVPVGPVRIFGKGGTNYHRATFSTTQTPGTGGQPSDGATETFGVRTAGWGWNFGGGLELWVTRHLGFYAEGGLTSLKGTATDEGAATLNERLMQVALGATIRVGG